VHQIVGIGGEWLTVGCRHIQELAGPRNVVGARSIGDDESAILGG